MEPIKLLYLDDLEILRELALLHLESEFDCTVSEARSFDEAVKHIENNDSFDIIFSDYDLGGKSGGDFYQYLKEHSVTAPFVLVTSKDLAELPEFSTLKSDNPHNAYLNKGDLVNDIISITRNALQKDDNSNEEENEYSRISIEKLKKDKAHFQEVFIKISETKYIKIPFDDNGICENELTKYQEKGLNFLYLKGSEFKKYSDSLAQRIIQQLKNDHLSVEKKAQVEAQAVAHIDNLLQNINVDEQVLEMIDAVNGSVIKELQKDPAIKDLIKGMIGKENYLTEHSMLISYIACALAGTTEWKNEKTFAKLSTAAILHDLCIDDAA